MSSLRHLVVSVHDVAPPTRSHVERLLDVLASIGVRHRSLLVIPNLRGQWPIDIDDDFSSWLRERRQEGDEVVQHGYQHVGVGVPRNARERFSNRWLTQGEGEFLSLDYGQAMARMAQGRAVMDRAGLLTKGFVAPAWLINAHGLRAASDLGFQYTNSYLAVEDLVRRRSHVAPSLVFGPGRLNEDVGIALQRRASPLLARCAVVRVVLHPPCIDHPARLMRVMSMIDEQLRSHEPVTYLQLLAARGWSSSTALQSHHAS